MIFWRYLCGTWLSILFSIVVACKWLLVSPGLRTFSNEHCCHKQISFQFQYRTFMVRYLNSCHIKTPLQWRFWTPRTSTPHFFGWKNLWVFPTKMAFFGPPSPRPSRCRCCSSSVQRCSACKLEAWCWRCDGCQAWGKWGMGSCGVVDPKIQGLAWGYLFFLYG